MKGVKITGIKEVEKLLKDIEKEAKKELGNATKEGAEIIKSKVEANAPVRTGKLKKSIKIRAVKNSGGKVEYEIYSELDYAGYVEMGTRYKAARPFFRPAVDENSDKATKKILDVVGKGIDRVK